MNLTRYFLRPAGGLALGLLLTAARPVTTPSPAEAADCQRRVARAYVWLDQLQQHQQRQALELRLTLYTTFVPPGRKELTTTTAHMRLVTQGTHSFWTTGEADCYQDGQVQVTVARAQRLILITAAPAQSGDMLARWLSMRQEMKTQATVTECRVEAGGKRYILMRPQPGTPMAGQVTSLAYWLHPRTDELHRLTLSYPPGYGARSVSMVLDGQRLKPSDAAVDKPALRQVFDSNKRLLPAYRTFTVQDQRRN